MPHDGKSSFTMDMDLGILVYNARRGKLPHDMYETHFAPSGGVVVGQSETGGVPWGNLRHFQKC